MRIAMFTNLYRPMLGGVSISIDRFSQAYRQRNHDVLIVAPDYPGQSADEHNVVRVPALQHFGGTDYSFALPPGEELIRRLDAFEPELIHSHHPFLLGDTAVRVAIRRDLPLVYTHHTMYEYYTHYVSLDSKMLRSFVVQLATRYARFCSVVIAPSESVAGILRERGVSGPIEVVPTGVVVEDFASGDGARGRRAIGLEPDAFVIGHVGRLAQEKNLLFLTRGIIPALKRIQHGRFLVVGAGDMEPAMRRELDGAGLGERVLFAGVQRGQKLADLYAAMDVFVFASKSETQGMVLAEALAAGTPVVALDAPGASEVVNDGRNGRVVWAEQEEAFAEAVCWVHDRSAAENRAMADRARLDAEAFALDKCVDKALGAYGRAMEVGRPQVGSLDPLNGDSVLQGIRRELEIWANRAVSITEAVVAACDPRNSPS